MVDNIHFNVGIDGENASLDAGNNEDVGLAMSRSINISLPAKKSIRFNSEVAKTSSAALTLAPNISTSVEA